MSKEKIGRLGVRLASVLVATTLVSSGGQAKPLEAGQRERTDVADRIAEAREKFRAVAEGKAQPAPASRVAQWFNFPNFPNFPNYFRNFPNFPNWRG